MFLFAAFKEASRDSRHMIPHISRLTILVSCCLAIVGIFLALILAPYLTSKELALEPKEIRIAPGTSTKSIAKQLADERIIRSSLLFEVVAYFEGASRYLQAGTYELSAAMSPREIIHQLKAGKVVHRHFVVPEGLTMEQIAQLFKDEGFGTAESFNRAARDLQWQKRYGIEVNSLEGYLFPNTYKLVDGIPAAKVIKMMLDEFNRNWTRERTEEAESINFSPQEIITLASIIEKEAKIDSERPLISAVFHNRLKRGWKLEADPTVLYALGNPLRALTTRDLKFDSSYNTYVNRGLPPAPICNPGLASIMAALRPAESSHLYFVAIGDGKHYFSNTLAEHNRVVRRIRRNANRG